MSLSKIIVLLLALHCPVFASAQAADDSTGGVPPRVISDSLVENLRCDQLTPENVFTFIRKDAFNTFRQIPLRNWPSGMLQVCWSLSLAQRDLFYLTRFGVSDAPEAPSSETVGYILNIVSSNSGDTPKKVFPIRETAFYRFGKNMWDPVILSPFFADLVAGLRNPFRNFKSEIEATQVDSFWALKNFKMILGNRARSESDNQETLAKILENLKAGRMPLVILRAEFFAQHVVLIKGAEKKEDGSYLFTLYDSAQPLFDQTMEYRNDQFYGGKDVVFRFDRISDYKDPIGVFLENDAEMDELQKANYEYYSELCGRP